MLFSAVQTSALLNRYNVPQPPTRFCRNRAEVLASGKALRYPLVLKASSREETHKTEKGLVQLGIHSGEELADAFSRLEKKTKHFAVDAFVVQEQLSGVEFIVGGHTDPTFGPVVLFGLGGVFAELLNETALRVVPFSKADAKDMVLSTKAAAFFTPEGFRGKKANLDSVVNILVSASSMMQREKTESFDFNPLICSENGSFVVDARVVTR